MALPPYGALRTWLVSFTVRPVAGEGPLRPSGGKPESITLCGPIHSRHCLTGRSKWPIRLSSGSARKKDETPEDGRSRGRGAHRSAGCLAPVRPAAEVNGGSSGQADVGPPAQRSPEVPPGCALGQAAHRPAADASLHVGNGRFPGRRKERRCQDAPECHQIWFGRTRPSHRGPTRSENRHLSPASAALSPCDRAQIRQPPRLVFRLR